MKTVALILFIASLCYNSGIRPVITENDPGSGRAQFPTVAIIRANANENG